MYDFHMHSTWSDGVLNEEEILQKIKERGIKFFSLTDHDNIEGSKRILNHKKFLEENDIKFIIGAELSSHHNGRKTHLLAYDFDKDSQAIKDLLQLLKKRRWEHTLYRLDYLKKKFNIILSDASIEYMKNRSVVSKPIIAECMKNEGYVERKGEAIREYIDKVPEKNFSVSPTEIIEKVHQAGGKVFLAHPFGEESEEIFEQEEFEEYINGLVKMGIDGIECYYSAYKNSQIEYLLNLANEKKMMISAGSDYHGIKYKLGEIGKTTLEDYKIQSSKLTILNLFKDSNK